MNWPQGCQSAQFSQPPGVGSTGLAVSPPFLLWTSRGHQYRGTWTRTWAIKRDGGNMKTFLWMKVWTSDRRKGYRMGHTLFSITYADVQSTVKGSTFWPLNSNSDHLDKLRRTEPRASWVSSRWLEGPRQWGVDLKGHSAIGNKWHFMFMKFMFMKVVKLSNNDIPVKINFL